MSPRTASIPVSRRDFWAILYSLIGEGVGILISTSYLDEAERCHRVGLLNKGKLLFCDRPEILKSQFPGAVFAVRTDDPTRVSNTLKGAPGVNRVVLEGDGVHLIVDRAERLPEMQSLLSAAGIAVEDFARSRTHHRGFVCGRGDGFLRAGVARRRGSATRAPIRSPNAQH